MLKTLVLVRHGKAVRFSDEGDDFSRQLAEPGIRSLEAMFPRTVAALPVGNVSVAVWSSPALRAKQTAEILQASLARYGADVSEDIEEHESLWHQDRASFLDELVSSPSECVFAVGHNPFIEELSNDLTGARIPAATGSMAVIAIEPSGRDARSAPNWRASRLLSFQQGPVSQDWKTLIQLESTLANASDAIEEKLTAFFENPEDIETMHKLRVSIRTLRSLVAFVKPWQDSKQNALISSQLKSVVACTSRLRELDVFAEQVQAKDASSSEFIDFCTGESSDERSRVMRKLKTKSTKKALKCVSENCHAIVWRNRIAKNGLPSRDVRTRFDEIAESLELQLSELELSEAEKTHDIRKLAKRVRYAAENFRQILGADAVDIAKGMTLHQDELGAVCDARVNIDMINGFLDRELPEALAWELTLMRAENETFLYTLLRSSRQESAEANV